MRRGVGVLGCLAWLALSVPASAEVRIEVRGRMRLDVDRIERSERAFTVSGALLDEASLEPMADHTVTLDVTELTEDGRERDAYEYARPVDRDGSFSFRVGARAHTRYVIHLKAPALAGYGAAQPIDREIDLGRRNLELRLIVPNELSASATSLPVVIEAVPIDGSSGEPQRGDDLPIELELDGASVGGSMLLKNGTGSFSLPLPRSVMHGELSLRARFAGDDQRAPAEVSAQVRIVERFELTLHGERADVVAGRIARLEGSLRVGTQGAPHVLVSLTRLASEDGVVATAHETALTDESGNYRAQLPVPTQGEQVRFQASVGDTLVGERRVAPANSPILVLAVTPAWSLFGSLRHPTGLALFVETLLALGLVALRARSIWNARRARVPVPLAAPVVAPERRFFGTLRLASDRRIGGRVEEADRGRPLANASIRVRCGSYERTDTSDAQGRFLFTDLPDGVADITIEHDGYKTHTLESAVPHRGAAAGLTVTLVPWRAEIFRRYAEALAPLLPPNEQLGARTPRELARIAERKFSDRAGLRSLQHLVEARCFGPIPAARSTFDEVSDKADKLTTTKR